MDNILITNNGGGKKGRIVGMNIVVRAIGTRDAEEVITGRGDRGTFKGRFETDRAWSVFGKFFIGMEEVKLIGA